MTKLERISAERRTFVGSAITSMGFFSFLSACGGSGADELQATESSLARSRLRSPSRSPARSLPPPPPTVVPGADRTSQTYLFQNVRQHYPSTIGGSSFNTEVPGPTYGYVDPTTGWPWTNPGGDYIDAKGVPQGPTAYASVSDPGGTVGTYTTYSAINVTALVQYVQTNNKHLALFTSVTGGGYRAACTNWHQTQPVPLISVTYTDTTVATLACRIVARPSASTVNPITLQEEIIIDPCFMEFERPTKPVSSATMRITLKKETGSTGIFSVNLCNPGINTDPVTNTGGLAASAGDLDANIANIPGVIGAQRYLDGAALSDFAVASLGSLSSEQWYDPALWGGTPNTVNKYPHNVVGKWVNAPPGLSLVSSSHTNDGFVPLAPGLGALKLVMQDMNIPVGAENGYAGTGASDMRLFMPFDQMGLISRIFVRNYVRFGTPHVRTPADRYETRNGGNPVWTDFAGKWGISPAHETSYGGTSGSSGGGSGWQMRLSWGECTENLGGPNEAGITPGWHLYDFGKSNPPGYNYSGWGQRQTGWGQRGGLGGTLYAGRWYEIETEVKLNTVNINGTYLADGELRAWIDGRLVSELTGLVFRTLPRYDPGYNGSYLRPFRELGVGWLWWNWFHGGLTQSTVQRTVFVTGLAWAQQRIGTMRGARVS